MPLVIQGCDGAKGHERVDELGVHEAEYSTGPELLFGILDGVEEVDEEGDHGYEEK